MRNKQQRNPALELRASGKYLLVLSLIAWLAASLIYFLLSETRAWLLGENRLVESLTALFYVLASLVAVYVLYWLFAPEARRAYLIIPIFGFLAFLDETSFGSSIFGYHMPYYAHYNIEIEGFKAPFQFVKMHVYFNGLYWQFDQLVMLLLLNLVFISSYIFFLRHNLSNSYHPKNSRILQIWLGAASLFAVIVLGYLLLLPAESITGCALACYSPRRWASIAVTALVSVVFLFGIISVRNSANRFDDLIRKSEKGTPIVSLLIWICGWIFLALYFFQLLPLQYQAIASRLNPIVFLLAVQGSLTAVSLFAWQGTLMHPTGYYWDRLKDFFQRRPPYYFVACAAFFLLSAQYFDLTIASFPNMVFFEEMLELQASIALFFGALSLGKSA